MGQPLVRETFGPFSALARTVCSVKEVLVDVGESQYRQGMRGVVNVEGIKRLIRSQPGS